MTAPVVDALESLRALADAQVDAARRVDVPALLRLNEARVDATFALQMILADPPELTDEAKAEARSLLSTIRALDLRLHHLARFMDDAIAPWAPNHRPPPTYGRDGRKSAT